MLLAACAQAGCGSSRTDAEFLQKSNDANIKKVCSGYQLYASRFRYTGPESKDELLTFLKTNTSIERNLELMGFDRDRIDDYFVSENDGKPFEFRWKVFIDPDRTREPLVFEQEGKNGVRMVMLANRKILEVRDDAKYEKLLKGSVSREEAKTDAEREEEAAAAAQ